jgi:uncharacterized protein YbcV (DUF1398 family)
MAGLNTDAIRECETGSFSNELSFPEVVQKLAAIGVTRYYADLLRMRKLYYSANAAHEETLPMDRMPIAENFSEPAIKSALASIQRGEIDYPEFLRRITAAGVVCYIVFIDGRRVAYIGGRGDQYVENFPSRN